MFFTQLPHTAANSRLSSEFSYPYLYKVSKQTQAAINELKRKLAPSKQGQMLAILVVERPDVGVGYLSGFSGKRLLFDGADIDFVPRLIDEMVETTLIEKHKNIQHFLVVQIEELQTSDQLIDLKNQLALTKQQADIAVKHKQQQIRVAKQHRKRLRAEADEIDDRLLLRELNQQSIEQKKCLTNLKRQWQDKVDILEDGIDFILNKISCLTCELNKEDEVFKHNFRQKFKCLNSLGESKSWADLAMLSQAEDAGDEAIVKLFDYAFRHGFKPRSFAQFWWGPSPDSEVRHHGQIYPVSQTRMKPILTHMMAGLTVEADPLLARLNRQTHCDVIYQDDDLVVINKPADLLSVPGRETKSSVYLQMRERFLEATGPLIVHRLDMATSGLMVIALNKQAHKHLQKQFIQRTVNKRYVAIINGELKQTEGIIKLPLRPDLNDRPRQVVCEQYGRYAETHWQVISVLNKRTRLHFFPKTGRSHQLRMHAAHQKGLAMPIIGDDLYGNKSAERLYLHADLLGFVHPVTNENMLFERDADF